MRKLALPGVAVESNYQLNIEDAELVSRFDTVVFADASVNAPAPFEFEPLEAEPPVVGFSSHSISVSSLLGLAKELFGATPKAFALGIRGYEFDGFGERLGPHAEQHLEAAVCFFVQRVQSGDFGM